MFTRNLHFHKYFDFTTFPFILPPGKGHQGSFLLLCFPAKLQALPFQFGVFPFSFPLFTFLQRKKTKRQQRGDEGEPLKIPKSSPASRKCLINPPSIPKHPRLKREKVFAKLPELNPLLENTHKNSFLFYTQLCQTAWHGCCSPKGMCPFPLLPRFPPFLAGSRQFSEAGELPIATRNAGTASWLPSQLATAG